MLERHGIAVSESTRVVKKLKMARLERIRPKLDDEKLKGGR